MTEVPIEGRLDARTLRRALRVHFAGFRLAGAGLAIASALVVVISLPRISGVGTALGVAALIFLILPYANEQRRIRSLPADGVPTEGVASDERIALTQGPAACNASWTSFHQAKVLDDVVILYQSSFVFFIVSRDFVANASDWQTLVSFVRKGVPRQHRSHTLPWQR